MNCGCNNEKRMITIEGDVGSDPIWCTNSGYNLDLETFSLGKELKERLMQWMCNYGKWIDWQTDTLLPNAVEQEKLHNEAGRKLTHEVQRVLDSKYVVTFKPSTMMDLYMEMERLDKK
jgi:hypothetical protein